MKPLLEQKIAESYYEKLKWKSFLGGSGGDTPTTKTVVYGHNGVAYLCKDEKYYGVKGEMNNGD